MSKIKYLISSLVLFVLSAAAVFAVDGLKETAEQAGIIKKGVAPGTIASKIGTITGAILSLVGIIFFGLMVYGGFLWMTAKGDETQAKKAQAIIVDAVIGLVIVAASYIITKFVFGAVK